MSHPVGTTLFVAAVVGNALLIAGGLLAGGFVIARRSVLASRQRWLLATEQNRAFHHPDHIATPLSDWLFMAAAAGVVLVGLPVALVVMFELVLPLLGRLWTH